MFNKKEYLKIKELVSSVIDSPSIGGNISIKDKNYIHIKSSGEDLKNKFNRNSISKVNMINNTYSGNKPSMELSFHKKLKKYVLHYHPLYINCFLC